MVNANATISNTTNIPKKINQREIMAECKQIIESFYLLSLQLDDEMNRTTNQYYQIDTDINCVKINLIDTPKSYVNNIQYSTNHTLIIFEIYHILINDCGCCPLIFNHTIRVTIYLTRSIKMLNDKNGN